MNRRSQLVMLTVMLLTFAFAGSARASDGVLVIDFEKDCPVDTCQETATSPVHVETHFTSFWVSGPVLHYTATETFTSTNGSSVTVEIRGMLDSARDPNLTTFNGIVTAGSWDGVNLVGANVHGSAERVGGTVFAGSLQIMPGSSG